MSPDDEDRLLGDYRLKRLRFETPLICQWLAEQVSVERLVLVDELKPEAVDHREKFLADVRAKAAIENPLIASVYEAVAEDGVSYFAHEFLPGGTLEARQEAQETMRPVELARLLRRIAEIQDQFEKQGLSTSPLGLDHIHLDSHGVLRLANLVIDGQRGQAETERDMTHLGHALVSLVGDGHEGATRMLTLLSWMRGDVGDVGEDVGESLTWEQVVELCARVERQLTGEPSVTRPVEMATPQAQSSGKPIGLLVITGLLGLAVIILLAMRARPDGEKSGRGGGRVDLPGPVMVPASAAGLDHQATPAFRIAAHEVTIGEYERFLSTLKALEEAGGDPAVFDEDGQPQEKASHVPDDWKSLLAAAREGSDWRGYYVTLDSPVVGVDWWDAIAYCEWKRGKLPTKDQWVAALGVPPEQVASIPAEGWGPVNPDTLDRSSHQVLNMAGSVSEWTLLPMPDPVNPLGRKKWLILGGSYLQEQGHAMSREWVDDRMLRRDDLGFRVVFDSE